MNWGARIVPARARPVPFCRQGLPRPPATRPRLFADWVPARRAFNSERTASCTRCGLRSAPKTPSSSVASFEDLPLMPRRGALGAATALLLPDLDDAVLGPRNRPLDHEQVVLGIDRVDGETDLGCPRAAHAPGHFHSLEDARGGR